MLKYLIPLIIFVVLAVFLWLGLGLNPREVPSPLINKPAPAFDLAQLHDPDKRFSRDEMLGKVWLLNVWASWCVSCRQEHPLLVELSRAGLVDIYGLNYKDQREDAKRWLSQLGDPYILSAYDHDGRIGIDYGVYGVPETYVINKQGIISHKVIGPVTPEELRSCVLPLVELLKKAGPQDQVTREEVVGCV